MKQSDYDTVPEEELSRRVSWETRETVVSWSNEKIRRQKWLGEGMLCHLLAKEWQLRPECYQIKKAEHGKPYIIGAPFPVFHNLSHSGDYLVCALSDREVGIDIQRITTYKPGIALRFFHPYEIAVLEACHDEMSRVELFFRYWSAKESFLKYTGTGLSASLSGFEVQFGESEIKIVKSDLQDQIYLKECRIAPEYTCCICSECPEDPEIIPFVFDKKV